MGKAEKGNWSGSWWPLPSSPSSICAVLGGPKEDFLSLMLGQGSQAQGGIFGIILGRDRRWTSVTLVVPFHLSRFCDFNDFNVLI